MRPDPGSAAEQTPAEESVAGLNAPEREDLLLLAALVADEQADPGALARAALAAVADRASGPASGDRAALARDELVRRALRPASRLGAGRSSTRTGPGAAGSGNEALRDALVRLPPRTRAAVVLRWWAGLPDEEVAAALRAPVATTRAELAAGNAALLGALPAGRALRTALDALARERAAHARPPGAADLRRDRRRRLRRRWVLAGAGCCAAVLAALAVLSGVPDSGSGPTASGGTSAAGGRVDLAELPTRGSLAGDEAFLAGMTGLAWTGEALGGYPPPVQAVPGTRRVLFAGDVPGGRWALVVGRPELIVSPDAPPGPAPRVLPGEYYMAWFTGPPGAEPAEMTLASYPYGLGPEVVPSLLDPRTGTLVVVASPGAAVEVSPGVRIDSDGADSRRWRSVDAADGVAVTQVPRVDVPWNWSVAFRVHREGRATLTSAPDSVLVPVDQQIPRLDIPLPGPVSEEGRVAADLAGLAVLAATGLRASDVELTAHAVTSVPEPASGSLALVSATLPSGAVVISAQWAVVPPDAPVSGSTCGLEVRAAGRAPEDGLIAARCEVYDPGTGQQVDQVLLVVAPPDVALVRVYRGNTTLLAEHAVPDGGVTVLPAPSGSLRTEAVTDGGVLLGRTEPLGQWLPSD